MDDVYYTIKTPSKRETRVKGSRFLAESELIVSIEEARAALERIRKREYAATHHCYAYRVGAFDRTIFKYSDGGEPSGTAGRPIYDAIGGHNLTNILVVVTRYFGGTKLGTGRLARTYGEAAKLVLEMSGARENFAMESYRLEVDFSKYDRVMRVLHQFSAKRTKTDYSERVLLEFEVRKSQAEDLIGEITSLTGGAARIEKRSATQGSESV